jgi:rSAM/selenodomain-associated transferase 1
MRQERSALLIFAKNAEKGKVKTRLARSIGEQQALEVYQRLLEYTKEVTQPLSCEKFLYYGKYLPGNDQWPADHYTKKLQDGEGLGARMENAFREIFNKEYDKAIIIGTDCPEITTDMLRHAFKQLKSHEVVIGPAQDGGYYLLGMRQWYPSLFRDISWSTGQVLKQTIEKIENRSATYSLLPVLSDVDKLEDLERLNT